MKEILYNYNNLKEEDINEVVVRTKALIVNSKDEIMLGYCNKTYHFPGGHLEENETLEECLVREIKEETGIEISNKNLIPFQKITHYNKNYHNSGKNRKNEIYYFIVHSDETFNINNTNLDKREIEGNFCIKVIPLIDVEKILLNSVKDNEINKIIVEEMLEALSEYKKIKYRR